MKASVNIFQAGCLMKELLISQKAILPTLRKASYERRSRVTINSMALSFRSRLVQAA